jgi:hypothetical protein
MARKIVPLPSVRHDEIHSGRRSRGWDPAIDAQAFCECGWEGPWRSWSTPGVTPTAAELIAEELAAHRADTGHPEFPDDTAGRHVRCGGWFHQFNDDCPSPLDSTTGRIRRATRATTGGAPVPAALDRLSAIQELRVWLDDEELQAVIGCRMARVTWAEIGQATGTSKQGAFNRWGPQIRRYEAAGLLDPSE